MMYLWPQAGSMHIFPGKFGCITMAAHESVPRGIRQGRLWALDNECFSRPFCFDRWREHWLRLAYYSKRCLFVVVPDEPFQAQETLALWQKWHGRLRSELDYFDNLKQYKKPWLAGLCRPGWAGVAAAAS